MTKVVVVIDEDGKFSSILTDSEIDVCILIRGTHDAEIDKAESELEEVESL